MDGNILAETQSRTCVQQTNDQMKIDAKKAITHDAFTLPNNETDTETKTDSDTNKNAFQ